MPSIRRHGNSTVGRQTSPARLSPSWLAKRLHDPEVEYWRSGTSHQELLFKPPHEAVFIDGPEQVVAYFQQLRPVPDAYRRYLPDASRVDWLPGKKTGRRGEGETRRTELAGRLMAEKRAGADRSGRTSFCHQFFCQSLRPGMLVQPFQG